MRLSTPPGDEPSRVLLVEPEPGGHHLVPYAAVLARTLLEAGFEPFLLTTPRAVSDPAMAEFAKLSGGQVPVRTMPEFRPARSGSVAELLRLQFRYWRAVRKGLASLTASERPGLCVLLSLDSCDRAIAALGSPCLRLPFIGLTIHAKHHWPVLGIGGGGRSRVFNQWTFDRVLAHPDCLGVATIDESLVDFEVQRGRHPGRVRHVPDPGEVVTRHLREEARAALGLDPVRPLVLVYGGLDSRKNIAALLAAALAARCEPLVALVGRMSAEIRMLESMTTWQALRSEGRLLIEDGFASSAREALWFSAADLVWVAYRADFLGQSAVIAQAASAGVPVLGRRGGLIGRTIESHRLGPTVDPGDLGAAAAAIDQYANARRVREFGDNLQRFAASRCHAAYARAWREALTAWWGAPDRRIGGD